MRGQTVHRAEINSTTRINGDGAMTILVRRTGAASQDEALLFLRNLLYSCGISDCAASVKFDDGPIRTIALARSTDMSSAGLFVSKLAPFLQDLKKAKRLIVEVDVFRNGRQQFVFEDVSGLKLPDVASAKKK